MNVTSAHRAAREPCSAGPRRDSGTASKIHRRTVADIERGRTQPQEATATRLVAALEQGGVVFAEGGFVANQTRQNGIFRNRIGEVRPMRKSNCPILEKLPFIDVRDLKKAGALDGSWRNFWAPFRYDFLRRLETSRHRVEMTMRDCAVPSAFRVEWARCHFGGGRPWFRCRCGERVGRLYRAACS